MTNASTWPWAKPATKNDEIEDDTEDILDEILEKLEYMSKKLDNLSNEVNIIKEEQLRINNPSSQLKKELCDARLEITQHYKFMQELVVNMISRPTSPPVTPAMARYFEKKEANPGVIPLPK